jgi:MFS family permease
MSVASAHREPNRWAVLALLSVAQLMVVLDATIVTIAIPSAQNALHFSTESRQWIITAYALAFGSLLLLGGKLGDLFGRKWTLIAGLVGFSIAQRSAGWPSPSACSWPPERSRGHSARCSHPRRWGC